MIHAVTTSERTWPISISMAGAEQYDDDGSYPFDESGEYDDLEGDDERHGLWDTEIDILAARTQPDNR
jgi:hypothetical protein